MKEKHVDIFIINYFAFDLLKVCLSSIVEPKLTIRIVILDNHTDGDKLEELKAYTDHEVVIYYSNENVGFSEGCNLAFSNLKRDHGLPSYALFLNPDTELYENTIFNLYEALNTYNADLVYPKSIYPDGKLYCSGTNFNIKKMVVDNQYYKNEVNPVFCNFYQGSAFLIKGEVFDLLEGLDNKLFMYFDEIDLSFRLNKHGHKILYNPNVTIIHNASYSLKNNHFRKAYYIARNGFYIFRKYSQNKSIKNYFWFLYHHVFIVLFIWYLKNGYIKSIFYSIYGYYHSVRNRYGKL